MNDAARSTDWLLHNHDYAGTRYSPLDEITSANASRLTPACMFQMGERDNFQTGPIVHNGVMYVTTMTTTIALDAATCRVKWRHRWEPKDGAGWQRNRGVAIKDGRIVRATPDGYLLGLTADTGALLWARQVSKPADGETFTMAPMIFEDLVIVGPAGSENNIQGWVGAFRLSDGTPVWRFNTMPKPGEPGYDTWKNPRQTAVGGGAVWTSFSLDVVAADLHIAVTNPAPDLSIHVRQGENLYTNSIVVLDVRTGKLRWYRQLIANDSHDWDVSHATPLFSATVDGAVRRLVATAGKDGMLRAIDRDSKRVVYEAAAHHARECRHARRSHTDPRVSGCPRRRRMERSRVQRGDESPVRAGGGLVHDVHRLRTGPTHSGQAVYGRHHRDGSRLRRRRGG